MIKTKKNKRVKSEQKKKDQPRQKEQELNNKEINPIPIIRNKGGRSYKI